MCVCNEGEEFKDSISYTVKKRQDGRWEADDVGNSASCLPEGRGREFPMEVMSCSKSSAVHLFRQFLEIMLRADLKSLILLGGGLKIQEECLEAPTVTLLCIWTKSQVAHVCFPYTPVPSPVT